MIPIQNENIIKIILFRGEINEKVCTINYHIVIITMLCPANNVLVKYF